MKALGLISAIALAIATGIAVVVGVRSLPDIQRYRRMRAM